VGLLSALQVLAGSYDKGKIQSLIQAYVKEERRERERATSCIDITGRPHGSALNPLLYLSFIQFLSPQICC
jgi:hypothetical protein